MINGLYTATSGMAMQQRRMDIISSNLANLNTVGHKKEVGVFSEYIANASETPDDIIRNSDYNKMINSTVRLDDIKVNFQQGYLKETGNSMDMALTNPNAFFAVDTPYGVRFTRDGSFILNEQGELTTKDGFKVVSNMDSLQPVQMVEGAIVNEEGEMLLEGALVNNIEIAQFEDLSALQKTGRNLYVAVDALPDVAENPGLMTGYLEGSNVNPVEEMVKMIEASRGFETYSKIITTFDEIDSKAVNEVGIVS
ncbi:fagellar hook-basal body protein [Denitrovibrio acetiphilus DSM 12809]|uniref:Fagellar hook-basal body protein n=1 Tax=Denitrovibrio acetiphilus (strain DSM 12809 / NBRC 114555 / N2460) TaxID=522772 RepID=D4H4B1_DENA2|nr:flagellar hook-basal body protein [Denitrovibrio acetiphilus]ADD69240.1 fagellar hook-basal body protein [Denitrovibrio acetiphilus DSM 12809]